MKWLLFLLAFVGCTSSGPKTEFNGQSFQAAQSDSIEKAIAVKPAKAAERVVATVSVKNRTGYERLQWAHVSVPLPKGLIKSESDLSNLSTHHGANGFEALKWHFSDGKKDSIAIAGMKFPVHLKPNEERSFEVFLDKKKNTLPFAWGSHFAAALSKYPLHQLMYMTAKIDGNEYLATLGENGTLIAEDEQCKHFRFHSNFQGEDGKKHALSATFYLDVCNRQDFGGLVVAFGNQTFEMPHSGGIKVEDVKLYSVISHDIRRPGDYGAMKLPKIGNYNVTLLSKSALLADGTARSFRGVWGVVLDPKSLTGQSYLAELKDPLIGMADRDSWDVSKAGGIVGNVMPPRKELSELIKAVEPECDAAVNLDINVNNPFLNKAPHIAGDQPDFSSNMPGVQQRAILTSSSCPVQKLLHGIMAAQYRPSYFFFEGRRMRWTDTPSTCFFWSGRPHYDVTQNRGHCDQWLPRVQNFSMGNSPWTGEDDQHAGSPHIRATYELTGDAFIGDIVEYRQSLSLWAKLGDHKWQRFRIGSERAIRSVEDALQLYLLKPNTEVADELLPRMIRYVDTWANGGNFGFEAYGVNDRLEQYGVALIETVYNDGRHPECVGETKGAKCVNGKACEQNICGMPWWTGFSIGWLSTMYRHGFETKTTKDLIYKYMSSRKFIFREDGMNAVKRRFNDWSIPATGSFSGQSWYSGWISAVETVGKSHPEYSFFKEKMIPVTRAAALKCNRAGCAFEPDNDKWFQ